MLPLSFSEYRNALQPTANDNALFDRYLTYGGLLYVTQLTLDTIGLGDYQDIRHRNILDWLLESGHTSPDCTICVHGSQGTKNSGTKWFLITCAVFHL